MSSTAGNETAKDSMDEIKAVPEQRSQGTSSPSLLGSYFEAGDEDQGEPLGSTHWPWSWAWAPETEKEKEKEKEAGQPPTEDQRQQTATKARALPY